MSLRHESNHIPSEETVFVLVYIHAFCTVKSYIAS